MRKILSILCGIVLLCTIETVGQTVVGYSSATPINISPQKPVSGFSSAVSVQIGNQGSVVSGVSTPVIIDIPESVIHHLPDKRPAKPDLHIKSDVDTDIPQTKLNSPNTIALVIGNEDYSSHQTGLNPEVNVAFAEHDARIFHQYLTRTLGVPEKNIELLINAKLVETKRALTKLNLLIKAMNGDANVIVYYAGHGLPHESTKEPYLIPVDISANDLGMAIKLSDFYKQLTEHPSEKITVFLDACFSGGAREQGLLAARGVKIQPREEQTQGRLVVFAAASGNQSALPYKEKGHGMFTYHLLKALQTNKGNITLGDLSEYLIKEVGIQSLMINSREQTPAVNKSPTIKDEWFDWFIY